MRRLGLSSSCLMIAVTAGWLGCATGSRPESLPALARAFPGVSTDAVRSIDFNETRSIDDVVLPSDRRVYLEWRPLEPDEAPASPHPYTPENRLLSDLVAVAEAVVVDLETVESRVVALTPTQMRPWPPGAESIYTFVEGPVVEVLAHRGPSPQVGDRRRVAIRGRVVRVKQATVVMGDTSHLRAGARVLMLLEPLSAPAYGDLLSQGATHGSVPPSPYEIGPPGYVVVPGVREPTPLERLRRRLPAP